MAVIKAAHEDQFGGLQGQFEYDAHEVDNSSPPDVVFPVDFGGTGELDRR